MNREEGLSLTRAHAFFMIMGGFHYFHDPTKPMDYDRNPPSHRITERGVIVILQQSHLVLPIKAEIQDRGKSDWIAKLLVLIQVSWFIIQCISRAAEHLAITELEIVTLAYAIINFGIYLVWWDKPRNVGYQSSVPQPAPYGHRGTYASSFYFGEHNSGGPAVLFWLAAISFGAAHCLAWSFEFPSYNELILWRISSAVMMAAPLSYAILEAIQTLMDDTNDSDYFFGIYFLATIPLYLFARVTTLVLAFTTLKSLPFGAYKDVGWMSPIPYI
jgi:hypothetical protein